MSKKELETPLIKKKDIDWWNRLGFIVAVATLLATFLAIYIAYQQFIANKKELEISIISNAPLVSIDEEYKNDLKIVYRGQEIKEAISTIVRVENSGNQPITAKDFNRPISFYFDQSSEIINANIIDSKPNNLGAKIVIEDNKAILNSILINPEDIINISLLSSSPANLLMDARISGISNIEFKNLEEELKLFFKSRLLFQLIVAIFTGIYLFFYALHKLGLLNFSKRRRFRRKEFLILQAQIRELKQENSRTRQQGKQYQTEISEILKKFEIFTNEGKDIDKRK